MSSRAYQERPTRPRPVPIYLSPEASPATVADELEALRLALPAWLCLGERWASWRYEWDAPRQAWGKVPLDALVPGRFAKATDARTWGTLRDAVTFRRRFNADGVSRVLCDGEEIVAIDLDGVRDPVTAELTTLAQATLAELPGVYTEVSPSGTGLHLFLRQPFPEPGRQGRRTGHLEIYSGARFMTVTGRVVRRAR